jgi:hypothetical protein
MAAGHDGSVWVERRDLGDVAVDQFRSMYGGLFDDGRPVPTLWDVFDGEGRYLGRVELPPRFRAFATTASTVTGVVRDDLDVEYVVRYRVGFGSQ